MSHTAATTDREALIEELGFDPEALQAKYDEEREKRLRSDGNAQYIEVKGDFSNYVDDPYIEKDLVRDPLTDDVEVVIIGGGFGGLLLGARLKEAGIADVRIIDKAGDFGGTWYWNRYPGAACDVESYIYLPLLEEVGTMPKHKFVTAQEIFDHSKAIADKYDLAANACLQTEVTACEWDEDAQRWIVQTNRKDRMRAKFVCMANGVLHRPKLPGIPGIETFKGHTFHTSRWDYEYTGGDSNGNLDKLHDKTVGIIGTGATAVQCVPHLGASAKRLYVFQRTPSSVDVREDYETDPEWVKSLEPGWQKRRIENFTAVTSGEFVKEHLVRDTWTDMFGNMKKLMQADSSSAVSKLDMMDRFQIADFQKMSEIRARVDSIVEDRDTADKLKAWYNQLCKRPCMHNEYLETFNRPNVQLVDTDGKGVTAITETSVIVGEKQYAVDCLIFATGFEVGTGYTRRSGYDLTGRNGISLKEKWEQGVSTLWGVCSHGFPNMFLISNTQATLTVNFPHYMDEQAIHIAHIIAHCRTNKIATVEPTQDAEAEWVAVVTKPRPLQERFLNACTPGYYNNEGQSRAFSPATGFSGIGPKAYFTTLKKLRDAGQFDGMTVIQANSP